MKFYTQFKWAVPHAFESALKKYMFIGGHTLYDTPLAYEKEWGEVYRHIKHSIQLVYPSKEVKRPLSINWNSYAAVKLYSYDPINNDFIETTQGRLFTLLWKGDIGVLDPNTANPKPPSKKEIEQLLKKEI